MAARLRTRRTPIAASLAACFGLAGMLVPPGAQAQARPAPNAVPQAPVTKYGAPIDYRPTSTGAQIIQSAPSNIVNWNSFDIGSAAKLTVQQPSSSAVLLNKVEGGALAPTMIDGLLNANGRVYIYNPNGIVFGKTSQVNVGALIASSLAFDENRVKGGLVLPVHAAALAVASGVNAGKIVVEGDASGRAQLSTDAGGLLMLAAPNVINNGSLKAPDGQVVLAAGNKVYLASPNQQQAVTLRGLVVEVSNDTATAAPGVAADKASGTAENGEGASIQVGRGNATMIGYAVNQKGMVSATTSTTLNGSIYLYARDQARSEGANAPYVANRAGKVTLGEQSVTQVLPALDDMLAFLRQEQPALPAVLSPEAALAAFQALPLARQTAFLNSRPSVPASAGFNPSEVKLDGVNLELQGSARITAPSGKVSLTAERLLDNITADTATDPNAFNINPLTHIVRVDLSPQSVIDVSGTTGTPMAMESNVITVDLRGTELADNVVLRNSALYGSKAQIDIRKGAQAAGSAANVAGWLALVEKNLGQLTAGGGTVAIDSQGAIIQRPGSSIKVNGGWVDYLPGYINTSKLVSNDGLVDISAAQGNTLYSSIGSLPNGPNNYEPGYREGSSAGTVQFSAPVLVMQGQLSGSAVAGIRQRDVSAANYPQGGKLEIGTLADAYAGTLKLGASDQAVAPKPGAIFDLRKGDEALLATRLDLDTSQLVQQGFGSIKAFSSGNIDIDGALSLPAGGALELRAGVAGTLFSGNALPAGGNLSIKQAVSIPGGSLTGSASGLLQVADGVSLDLAGRWTNDRVAPALDADGNPSGAYALQGGSLNLTAAQTVPTRNAVLAVGDNVSMSVSAGAWHDMQGKDSKGKAGSITLAARPINLTSSLAGGAQLTLGRNLALAGYGFGTGGKLSLVGRNVVIGPRTAGANAGDLNLDTSFFQQGGFSQYTIGANLNFDILGQALLTPRSSNWLLGSTAASAASGTMAQVASPVLYELNGGGPTRSATSLDFQAPATAVLADGKTFNGGSLTVQRGAQVALDPGASLSLLAGQQLSVDGLLSAPGGAIKLLMSSVVPGGGAAVYRPERSIWFGPHAQLLATGSSQRLSIGPDKVASGELLGGGSIEIGDTVIDPQTGLRRGAFGYVVAEAGSLFDVSGAYAGQLSLRSGSQVSPAQEVSSNGGRIDIRTREGLLFAGALRGQAGSPSTAGGSLNIGLEGDGGTDPALDPRILSLSAKAPSLPKDLAPGRPLAVDYFSKDKTELGWFLQGSRPDDADPLHLGMGWLGVSSFNGGGFGRLNFKAPQGLAFNLGSADLTLAARDAVVLDSPLLLADTLRASTALAGGAAHQLRVNAPYVRLGSGDSVYQLDDYLMPGPYYRPVDADHPAAIQKPSVGGSASLLAQAGTLDLVGNSATQGFGKVNLNADADIRLLGLAGGAATNSHRGYATGAFSVTGNLSLQSAQTYPTTLSDFTLSVSAVPEQPLSGQLSFAGNGKSGQLVYSAGGSVTALAPSIVQGGQLLAPFGQIRLGDQNTLSLSYGANSLTSVAGAGVVPFGALSNSTVPGAATWNASLNDGLAGTPVTISPAPNPDASTPERMLPQKAIYSQAQSISSDASARLDAAGGGTLYAYAFNAGKGGSRDVLASPRAAGGQDSIFAINPNYQGAVAPVDGEGSGGLVAGARVYLSGMPGLAAGYYTLLPAHYALLPGGYSISAVANTRDLPASGNTVLPDGAMLVSGALAPGASNSALGRRSGFLLMSGKVIRSKSEFGEFDASTFFADQAQSRGVSPFELPRDGGYLAFQVNPGSAQLNLKGGMRLAAADKGRAGYADFTAPDISIVSQREQGGSGSVNLAADQLTSLGADSVLIGALRAGRDDGLHLSQLARSVTLSNNAAHPLSAADVTLAASDSVRLEVGAVLQATGTPARPVADLSLDGDGAVLRVGSGAPARVTHDALSFKSGKLSVASGASIGGASVYLDATGQMDFGGQLALAAGGALSVNARGIDLGAELPGGAAAAGIQFGTPTLDLLSQLSELTLNSYDKEIRLAGDVTLGSAALRRLQLQGAGLSGLTGKATGSAPQVLLQADRIRLDGRGGATAAVASPAGRLQIQAGSIELGSENFAVHGYADVRLSAQGDLLAAGNAGQLSADRDLTLAAARIGTRTGRDASFVAGATLTLAGSGTGTGTGAGASAAPLGQGGALGFAGADVVSTAQIAAPSGQVQVAAANAVKLDGGTLSVAGRATNFSGTMAYAPAGSIALSGRSVSLGQQATLDLTAQGAAAGSLSVDVPLQLPNTLQLLGRLQGAASAGADGRLPAQGQFTLHAGTANASPFGALNATLNAAGFSQSRHFAFDTGNVVLNDGDLVAAQDVRIATGMGNITLQRGAVIDASGEKGGNIALYASHGRAGDGGGNLLLADGARLRAVGRGVSGSSAGSIGNGGHVELGVGTLDGVADPAAGGGSLAVNGGIDVSGSSAARNGSVLLRAPVYRKTDERVDLAVASVGGEIHGSADTALVGYRVYRAASITEGADSTDNLNAGASGLMYSQAGLYSASRADIAQRLGLGNPRRNDPNWRFAPGIEVQSRGDLLVSVNELASAAAERGWDLGGWRFGGSPVELSLRAAGNLEIRGSLSDGFVKPSLAKLAMPDWQLGSGRSASYRLVGGADLGAADPLATLASPAEGKGDVLLTFAARSPSSSAPLSTTDAPVALVRTGSGTIEVAAARDITLAMAKFFRNSGSADVNDTAAIDTNVFGASLYTAGQALGLPQLGSFEAPSNILNPLYGADSNYRTTAAFGEHGGAITLQAGRDINGPHNLGNTTYHLPGTPAVPPDPSIPKDPGTPAEPGELDYLPGTVPQLVNNWLYRQGRSYVNAKGERVFETTSDGRELRTAWWSRTDYFDQGVATLGGGDLSITAGRHIADLSASVASSAFVPQRDSLQLREQGGGDLLLRAGGDLRGGSFYVQKGSASLSAGGDIGVGAGGSYPFSPDSSHALAPVLAMGDARFDVSAGGSLRLEGVFNPTQTAQSLLNRGLGNDFSGVDGVGNGVRWDVTRDAPGEAARDAAYRLKYAQFSNFSTYGANSALNLTAIGGKLSVSNDAKALARAGVAKEAKNLSSVDDQLTMYNQYLLAPANYRAVALNGDLSFDNGMALTAAPRGQLDLLAGGSIALRGTAVRMLDSDPANASRASAPRVPSQTDLDALIGAVNGIAAHTLGGLHSGDRSPVHVIARDGDIAGDGGNGIHLALPKTAQIVAGRDIRDLGFQIQQANASDILSITAGRDFIDSTPSSPSNVAHVVTGPGRVELSAGHNVDFGNGGGLVTRGNLDNPYLAPGGASISVTAGGAAPNYAAMASYASQVGFVGDLVTSLTALTASEQGALLAFVKAAGVSLPGEPAAALAAARQALAAMPAKQQAKFLDANTDALRAFVKAQLPKTPEQAPAIDLWLAFRGLPQAAQDQFLAAHPAVSEHLAASAAQFADALARQDKATLNQLFFRGLVETSRANPDSKFKAFDQLIASLFPAGAKAGDIALYNSQIKTEQGGAIDLFAPGGSVYAGLTVGVSANDASKQGIFTIQDGAIRSLVKNDFLVNQGRVFTLGGGDITLVSQNGNIDAGRGAKTATSAPPPRVTIDANGSVKLDVSSSISGSGIATLKTRDDQPASNVYPIAPRGIFDAGDAGVRSTGTVEVVAAQVRNADNITAAGSISGAAGNTAVAPPAAPPTVPSNTQNSDEGTKLSTTQQNSSGANSLSVEVLGYGEDEDEDAKGGTEEEKKKRKAAKAAKQNQAALPSGNASQS